MSSQTRNRKQRTVEKWGVGNLTNDVTQTQLKAIIRDHDLNEYPTEGK